MGKLRKRRSCGLLKKERTEYEFTPKDSILFTKNERQTTEELEKRMESRWVGDLL
jgi:hypothetical protein